MSLLDNTDLSLQAAIRGAGLRQTALAQNVANANTPGYQRKDVDFESSLRAAMADGQNPDNLQFGVQTDAESRKPPKTHVTQAGVVFSSCCSCGSAGTTIVCCSA